MSSAPLPWLKFYARDWMTSSRVRMMPFEARGIYFELLLNQWEEGHLPAAIEDMAALIGASVETLERHWRHLESAFPLCEDGYRRNDKLREQRAEAHRYTDQQSQKGKASAAKRTSKIEPKSNHGSTTVPTTVQPEFQQRFNHTDTETDTDIEIDKSISCRPSPSDDAWMTFQTTYPKRGGQLAMSKAKTKFYALVKNDDLRQKILEGVARYREYCDSTGKTGTEYVQMATTWLNREGWSETWELPKDLPQRTKSGGLSIADGLMKAFGFDE